MEGSSEFIALLTQYVKVFGESIPTEELTEEQAMPIMRSAIKNLKKPNWNKVLSDIHRRLPKDAIIG